jgi:hypothetical protein
LWTVAENIWAQRPLTGFGTGSFKFEFPRFQHLGARMGLPQFKPYNYSEHAHSEVLQFGAELGAVGVGLFLWGTLAWLIPWIRVMRAGPKAGESGTGYDGRRREWWTQFGIGTSLFASFTYGWVNFPLQIVPTALLWWGLMGLSLGRMDRSPVKWRIPRIAAVPAGILLASLGVAGAFATAVDLAGSSYLWQLHGRLERGDNAGARKYGLLAAKVTPHDVRVFSWLGRLGIVSHDERLVEDSIQARLKIHPYRADALLDRAELMRSMGRNSEAEIRYREVLAVAPNFASAWGVLGELYFERKEYAKAVEAFTRAADVQDGNAVWHHDVASACGALKRYKEALAADEEAIKRDPRFVDAYVGVALSARALGDKERARSAALQAYRINPQDSRAARLLQQLQ